MDYNKIPFRKLLPQDVAFAQIEVTSADWKSGDETFTRWTSHHHIYNRKYNINCLEQCLDDLWDELTDESQEEYITDSYAGCMLQWIDKRGNQHTFSYVTLRSSPGWVSDY